MGKMHLTKKEINELLKITIGCVLYALSVVMFLDPANIIPGSVTGIGIVVKAITGFPIGILSIIINVPLVIIGTIIIGKKLLIYTGITVLLSSVLIDAFAFINPFTEDMLLASIFGGVVMGIGLGLILDAGGTTGGTTVVGRLVLRKFPHIPMGNILLIGDFIIITVGSVLLRNWDLLLYSIIDLYICVVVINKVMYGFSINSLSIIVTDKRDEIEKNIKSAINCKIIKNDNDTNDNGTNGTLMCICRKQDISKLQHAAEKTDEKALCTSLDIDYSFGKFEAESTKQNS